MNFAEEYMYQRCSVLDCNLHVPQVAVPCAVCHGTPVPLLAADRGLHVGPVGGALQRPLHG